MMTIFQKLIDIRESHGCGFLVLLDPDKQSANELAHHVREYDNAGVDAFLYGSSVMLADRFEQTLREIKDATDKPVIIFPASSCMVSKYADAILFLSLVSGRNPNLLIEEQVKVAPMIKAIDLEPISTAYMLVESGNLTSVSFLSNTLPIPRDKSEIACAHALAAQYLGMKLIYLEAGSGAKMPVPLEMVKDVRDYIDIPIIVGGGITEPEYAGKLAKAGASFVVIGNALEKSPEIVKEFVNNVHWK